MRTKKKLDNYVQKDLSCYEDENFLKHLKANAMEAKQKQPRRILRIVFPIIGVALVLVACVGLLLWAPWENTEWTTLEAPSVETIKENDVLSDAEKEDSAEERHYLFEDQVSSEITLEELQSVLKHINFSAGSLNRVMKVENAQYDEILYYTLQYSFDDMEEIKIAIVTNKQYEYTVFYDEAYSFKDEIYGVEIYYNESYAEEDEGLYTFEAKGEMSVEDGMIYIEYSGIWFEETSNFIPRLRSIVE